MPNSFSREALLHVAKTLPAAPQILARLGELRLEPDADLTDVTALLRRDASLTARIIRIANSAIYTTGASHASLEQALARVGFGEIYRIAGFAVVAQTASQGLRLYGISGPQLRENSLLTALIVEEMAKLAGTDSHEAYSAGLLRSTGKILLDGLARDLIGRGPYVDSVGQLADWEHQVVGLGNSEAASIVLSEWRFPTSMTAAIGFQYRPEASGSSLALASLLNLAAGAAHRLGHPLPGELHYWDATQEKLAAAGIDHQQMEDAARRGLEQFGQVRASIA
jgi:HD-like signal output (HDOD) protein